MPQFQAIIWYLCLSMLRGVIVLIMGPHPPQIHTHIFSNNLLFICSSSVLNLISHHLICSVLTTLHALFKKKVVYSAQVTGLTLNANWWATCPNVPASPLN